MAHAARRDADVLGAKGECVRAVDCVRECGGDVVQSGCCPCPDGFTASGADEVGRRVCGSGADA